MKPCSYKITFKRRYLSTNNCKMNRNTTNIRNQNKIISSRGQSHREHNHRNPNQVIIYHMRIPIRLISIIRHRPTAAKMKAILLY